VFVLRLVSQPLLGSPSQSAKPDAQLGTHTPPVHAVVPFALLQLAPHAPQFWTVLSGASQPFDALASQSP
jgi:hypothetical protein